MKYKQGSQNISVTIPGELLQKLNELAVKTGISRNKLIKDAIEAIIKEREV